MTYSRVPFTDLLETIVDNRGRSCPTSETGLPLIATNCVKPDRLYPTFENIRHVSDETYATWFRGHPIPGDILFVCEGSPGRVALVPNPVSFCIAQDMVAVRADAELVYPPYLFAALRSRSSQDQIAGMHVGTMIPHFKKGDFNQLLIPVPGDEEQRFIGDTYLRMSEKYESNQAAIDITQELSTALFHEWRQNSSANTESTFGKFAEVYGGATPNTSDDRYWGGELSWATPTDMTALSAPYLFNTRRTITEAGLKSCAANLHNAGTVLMTSRATIGVIAVNQIPCATNQGFIAVRPHRSQHRWFLFEEMRSRKSEMLDRANGSTFLELSRGSFKAMTVRVPPEEDLRKLDDLLSPIHARCAQLSLENTRIARLRDTLLDGMMTGSLGLDVNSSFESAAT